MGAAWHRSRPKQLAPANLTAPHLQPGVVKRSAGPQHLRGQKHMGCREGRRFQSPEPGVRRQSWKGGQSLHCFVSKHSWDTSWEQFHTKTSALQISDCCCCGRESCWSYVNLKMGGVGSCQMDIWLRDPLKTRLEGAREKVGRQVICTEYQGLSWAIYTHHLI